jgi:hypothetical protein
MRRRVGIVVSGFVVLAVVAGTVSLPPRHIALRQDGWRPDLPGVQVRGAWHVHTRRSDGTGTIDEVATAAARAGLDFVILADHGDGTRTPDAPRYAGPVLVIDAVEISTRGGHYGAIGLGAPSPYRLGGAAEDVVEDVSRLGGVGVITHPDSPKRSLAWRDWSLPVSGFEWLNADSEWRDETRLSLARTLLAYPLRPAESIAALLSKPRRTLERWDRLSSEGRFLVTLAGADAHARLGARDTEDEDGEAWSLPLPGYAQVFRAVATVVELDQPLSRDAGDDARRLVAAIRSGRTYTSLDGIAGPGRLEFSARTAGGVRRMGDRIDGAGPVELMARALAPPGARLSLLRNGKVVAQSTGLVLAHREEAGITAGERGVAYRLEAEIPGKANAAPWIVSNPIFVRPGADSDPRGGPAGAGASAPAQADDPRTWFDHGTGVDLRDCRVEKDSTSVAGIEARDAGDALTWTWRIAEGTSPAWVALACSLPGDGVTDRAVTFRASSDLPLRLSVQVRDAGAASHRWERTVHVDSRPATYLVPSASLRPVGQAPPQVADRGTLLFVVDWMHGVPGMRRRVLIERAAIAPANDDQVRTVSSR